MSKQERLNNSIILQQAHQLAGLNGKQKWRQVLNEIANQHGADWAGKVAKRANVIYTRNHKIDTMPVSEMRGNLSSLIED